jgi:hypothetical protein
VFIGNLLKRKQSAFIRRRYRDLGMCFLMDSTEARMLLDAATKVVDELVGETARMGKAVD